MVNAMSQLPTLSVPLATESYYVKWAGILVYQFCLYPTLLLIIAIKQPIILSMPRFLPFFSIFGLFSVKLQQIISATLYLKFQRQYLLLMFPCNTNQSNSTISHLVWSLVLKLVLARNNVILVFDEGENS